MKKTRVAVVGYGVIGQRLADGVALQDDMELVGVADVAPTLSIRAMFDSACPYDLYVIDKEQKEAFNAEGFPVKGILDDLISKFDIILDATPAGIGARNKEISQAAHRMRATPRPAALV